jgi:hypothetical protein
MARMKIDQLLQIRVMPQNAAWPITFSGLLTNLGGEKKVRGEEGGREGI